MTDTARIATLREVAKFIGEVERSIRRIRVDVEAEIACAETQKRLG